jgi:hypothetical protein
VLHGISRGYTVAEILGEKWGEGGERQWKGIRGGAREVVHTAGSGHGSIDSPETFSLQLSFEAAGSFSDEFSDEFHKHPWMPFRYRIDVAPGDDKPRVVQEELAAKGQPAFAATSAGASDSLEVMLDPGRQVRRFRSSTPILSQLLNLPASDAVSRNYPTTVQLALSSMRFLDLQADAMRIPSLPGQTILGDRGENLSSVLHAICQDPAQKRALTEWIRQLTPLDAADFEFIPDAAGKILVTLVEENGQKTSALSASDGTLRFLAILAALLGPEPARFYFIEELENGIHPTRLHLLTQLIEQHATRSQVVATTHSPQLLAMLGTKAQGDAVLLYRLPGQAGARIRRILDVPQAREVLQKRDMARLHSSGWLENAVALTDDLPAKP